MNKLRFLVLSIAFLLPSIILPFASYYLLEKKGKQILIFGDWHNNWMNSINEEHFNALKALVAKYNHANNINCFLEVEYFVSTVQAKEKYKDYDRVNEVIKDNGGLTFIRFVQEIDNPKFFKVIPADARSTDSLSIFPTLGLLESCLFKNIKEREEEKLCFDECLKHSNKFDQEAMALSEYLELINVHELQAEALIEKYKDKKEFSFINNVFIKFKNSIDQLKKQIGSYDLNKPIYSFIIDFVKIFPNLKIAKDKFRYIREILIISNSIFADLFFLDYVLKDQAQNKKSVLCVGNEHAMNLTAIFKEMDYRLIAAGKYQDEKFEINLIKVCENFLSKSLNYCNFCAKKSTNQAYKQCSGCKQVHYCTPKCQKYDWEFHKNICNYVTGKHKLAFITPIDLDKNNE
ncbi:MAG: zinc finger MYND domain-containing protein [Candidatus Babeliales bacterium]|nr:zinc finger MYND domain-containing protein [Candidatus Babeliales bacterium]